MAQVIIPTKLSIVGDVETGKRDVGFARTQMFVLENMMRIRGLQQYSLTRRAPGGSIVECWSCFGRRHIVITANPMQAPAERRRSRCFCNGCVALGVIVNVHDIVFFPTDRINRCYDLVETYPEQNSSYYCADVVYDVQVCGESYYTLFEGVKALDNTPYCIDDNVIVTPFPSSDEADVDAESLCYASCGSACFAAASSLIISVAILPVDGAVIPRWSEVKESR